MVNMITAESFTKHVGFPPENDDLERCNCEKAGELGHFSCGWDHSKNLPRYMTGFVINPTDESVPL